MVSSEPRSVQPHDVEELLQTREVVVLAVDQVPFEVESRGVKNTFCLLVPLMTEAGVELHREQFPNRERVWWMLRSDIHPDEIRVGMIWSAPIERSREYGNPEREKDHYQVRRADIRPGARQYVEVLNLKVADPDLAEILEPGGIPWPYPPLQRVVVRGGRSVVGPFRTEYDYQLERLTLTSLTPGNPIVYRLPRSDFEGEATIREFSYTANRWDAKAQETRLELNLMHERDLTILQRDGEREDGATDQQVVNWALELMEIPKKDRQVFKSVFERAGEMRSKAELNSFPGRLERFLKLSENRQRIIELGSTVAEAVATREGFRELVDLHIDAITAERVEKALEERRSDIERRTVEAEGVLKGLNDRIALKQDEYQQLRDDWDREFDAEHRERIRRIEEREAALERQEKEMTERLRDVAAIYREEAKRFGDQLVAQIPILQRLGLLRGTAAPAGVVAGPEGNGAGPQVGQLELPLFLKETRARSGIDEEAFLEQFERVVAARGFVFDREDLINFHVLVKTGMWTVLTGPSGRGKSSLPRLYAEALGSNDEYLLVPVRPDWLDDRDVVGAFNALSGRYEPAACGLVDRLIAAAEDEKSGRGGLYIICLDEMNLARVEHYFAQFLSLLEQPPQERRLQLYASGLGHPDDPYTPYRSLPIGRNIRFVGTVNVDDTTHFFSPKVIDRAPIATFDRPDLRLGIGGDPPPATAGSLEPVHAEEYLSWIRPIDTRQEVLDLLLKVDEVLRRSRTGLGFRLRDRMLRYVASARHLLGEDTALDLALVQNVVPRLRSTAPSYHELLRELQALLPPGRFHRTADMLKALEEDPESDFFQLL